MHKQIEIVYVRKGRCVAYADKNSYVINSGDMFIAFPNQIHYYETLTQGEYMVIIFSPDIIHEIGAEISNSTSNNNVFNSLNNKDLKDALEKIFLYNGEYKNIFISGYLNIIMSIILPQITLETINTENSSTFYNIIYYCTHHYKDNITLDTVSEELHLSKYYVSHIINSRLKKNFNEYLNNLRISEACNLLKKTNKKIADISEDIGFGTIRSFNRAFKNVMGVSPMEYRNTNTALKEAF